MTEIQGHLVKINPTDAAVEIEDITAQGLGAFNMIGGEGPIAKVSEVLFES